MTYGDNNCSSACPTCLGFCPPTKWQYCKFYSTSRKLIGFDCDHFLHDECVVLSPIPFLWLLNVSLWSMIKNQDIIYCVCVCVCVTEKLNHAASTSSLRLKMHREDCRVKWNDVIIVLHRQVNLGGQTSWVACKVINAFCLLQCMNGSNVQYRVLYFFLSDDLMHINIFVALWYAAI